MPGKKFFDPLFSGNKKLYSYNLPLHNLRSIIENVFAKSGGILREPDIRGRFTGGDTFEMDAPAPAGPPVLHSKLYGVLREQEGKTVVETHIRPAISLRIWFWLSMALGVGYLVQTFITEYHFIWPALGLIILGPISAVMIANMNNAVIEHRYRKYIHKEILGQQEL